MAQPQALQLIENGIGLITTLFGDTACTIGDLGDCQANWDDLGARQELASTSGRRITYSCVVEFPRTAYPEATTDDFQSLHGQRVTRTSDGKVFRVVGDIRIDDLTVQLLLDSIDK